MELDEHVPVYVSEPEHPEYHVPSDDDMQVKDQPYADDASPIAESPRHIVDSESMDKDSINYPDEPEDDNKDPEEDHTDYHADGGDGDDEPIDDDEYDDDTDDEPSNDDDDDDDTDDKDEEPTKDEYDEEEEEHLAPADSFAVPVVNLIPSTGDTEAFETDESAPTPRSPQTRVSFSQTRLHRTRKTVRLEPPMSASIEARIAEHVAAPIPPTSPAYDQEPLAESSAATAARPPRGQYDFVDTVEAGQSLIHSPGHDTQTIARAADRAEEAGYINVVRGQRTAYETELHEVRQAYLSSEAWNRALLARPETLKTHISCMEWQRQSAEDLVVRQMKRIHVLEARAQIDKVEDTKNSCYRIMPVTRQGANDTITLESIQAMIDRAIQRNSTHTQDDASQSSGGGLRRHVQPVRVCSYTDFMKCKPLNFKGTEGIVGHDAAYAMTWGTLKKKLTEKYCPEGEIKKLEIELWNLKVDKYISRLPDKIHENVMSARPKTFDDAIELANDLIDQKLRTYAERQNDNKRKADDSSRNNRQQQPHKKQNIARAYTAGPGEKKAYIRNLPLCTKCNYHHIRQCAPKCVNCKRYGHTNSDCRVNTNNNNTKNQKTWACYECGNTGHIKRNFPILKNRGNGNGNGVAQGRAYAFRRKRC
nr:hypothetical protein [Tanacetum cinerariifolium]